MKRAGNIAHPSQTWVDALALFIQERIIRNVLPFKRKPFSLSLEATKVTKGDEEEDNLHVQFDQRHF